MNYFHAREHSSIEMKAWAFWTFKQVKPYREKAIWILHKPFLTNLYICDKYSGISKEIER